MEDLEDVYLSPLPDSPYVKPFRFNYTQNGKEKTWDLLEVHDSVAVIVFNITRKVLLFVKQFRPAVYYNAIDPEDRKGDSIDTNKYPGSLGVTLEMCAGIVDKQISVEHIACEEVHEELGYKITIGDLHKVLCYRAGVGVQGSVQTLYYCEVTDDMKAPGGGGGVDDEIIEVVELTIPQAERMLEPERAAGPLPSPPSCLFALSWFLQHKADKFRKSYEQFCQECKIEPQDDTFVIEGKQ